MVSLKSPNATSEFKSAREVAAALYEWHRSGAATGDVAFWAPHVESFDSPKAYALVVETLLEKKDFVSAMSLLVHWLNQAPQVALEDRDCSFHALAQSFVRAVVRHGLTTATIEPAAACGEPPPTTPTPWARLRKFFDYLEANADEYWLVPKFRSTKTTYRRLTETMMNRTIRLRRPMKA